jgi:hypothetical protein
VLRRSNSALLSALLLAALTAGCGLVPSRPDPQAFTTSARQGLGDAASEVATVKLALQEQQKDHLVGKYTVTTVTNSEEALGKAQDSVLTKQPPSSKQQAFDRISDLLGDAGDLVTEARIALVADQEQQYPALVDRLEAMTKKLNDLRSSL